MHVPGPGTYWLGQKFKGQGHSRRRLTIYALSLATRAKFCVGLFNIYLVSHWLFLLNVVLIRTRPASCCQHLRLCHHPTPAVTHSRAVLSGNFVLWPRTMPTSPSTSSHSLSVTAIGRPSRLDGQWPYERPSSSGWTTMCAVDLRRWGIWQSERRGRASATAAAVTSCTHCNYFVFRPGSTISFSLLIRSDPPSFHCANLSSPQPNCHPERRVRRGQWNSSFKFSCIWNF